MSDTPAKLAKADFIEALCCSEVVGKNSKPSSPNAAESVRPSASVAKVGEQFRTLASRRRRKSRR